MPSDRFLMMNRLASIVAGILIGSTLTATAQQITIALRVDDFYLNPRAKDGDTIGLDPLSDSQELYWADRGVDAARLVCVAAPERYERGGPEATAWLAHQLTLGPLRLEPGPSPRDSFGRMLGFAKVEGTDLNLEIIRAGLARADRRYPCPRRAEMIAAEADAQAAARGLWVRP